MFIIDLTYLVPLDQLDNYMPQHMAFLRECYKSNLILAVGESKSAIEGLMQEDPFIKMKLADAKVIEFQTSQLHGEFKKMLASIQ